MILYRFDNIHDSFQLAWSVAFVGRWFCISYLCDFYLKRSEQI